MDVSDDLRERLELAAVQSGRSLSGEAIARLEAALAPARIALGEPLARTCRLRAGLGATQFKARDIDALKRWGRP
jgi:hypothetical protein